MIVLLVLLAVTVAIGFVPGLALFAIVPGLMLLAYAIWLGLAFSTGRSPGVEVRRHRSRSPGPVPGPYEPEQPEEPPSA